MGMSCRGTLVLACHRGTLICTVGSGGGWGMGVNNGLRARWRRSRGRSNREVSAGRGISSTDGERRFVARVVKWRVYKSIGELVFCQQLAFVKPGIG